MTALELLTDEQFADLVDQELRDQAGDVAAKAIRRPENLYRWRGVLLAMKRDIEWQMSNISAARKEVKVSFFYEGGGGAPAYASYLKDSDRRRANSLRVLCGVEKRLTEVNDLIEHTAVVDTDVLRDRLNEALDLLSIGEDDTDNEAVEIIADLVERLEAA